MTAERERIQAFSLARASTPQPKRVNGIARFLRRAIRAVQKEETMRR